MDSPAIATAADEIAVIGMSGRFPGANNVGEFWHNLRNGVESISRFSAGEVEAAGLDPAILAHPGYVSAKGVLRDIDLFDAGFFGFTPREAEITDPQHRVFLECAWEALEDGGYDPARYPGAIGVFAGTAMSTYLFNLYSNPELVGLIGQFQLMLANDKDHLTTRLAYKLNLRGPAVTVQTTCSTSLVAVCVACQSLLNYQSDMALAGGVAINLPQEAGYFYQDGGIGSPDGHCRAFDAAARGTVPANGVGVVLLKRLADAVADGDCVRAVIKGSAINNDGSTKVGYTAPSVKGQAEVIAMAQALAAINPESIGYVEAHGTGTALGDPIEITALTQVFRAATDKRSYCAIGSVKTNIGHLDPAAGVAGLIKTVLAIEHEMLPPSLHFDKANPKIDFPNSPFFVSTRLAPWPRHSTPRRAAVSSFGIGGTNAHVVLEEAPRPEASPATRPLAVVPVSARSQATLDKASAQLAQHLRAHPDLPIADVAYTLQVGRRAFTQRRIVVARNAADAAVALDGRDPQRVFAGAAADTDTPVVFLFPGQGAQHVNMGAALYQTEQTFRARVDQCSEMLQSSLGVDLRTVLYPDAGKEDEMRRRLIDTSLAQPALFVIEYALAGLWIDWGVRPQAMLGHSLGELTAACLSGVLSLSDALEVVAARGRLMGRMPQGAMLAIPLPEDEVRPLLSDGLALAAINAPSASVVSGPSESVARIAATLSARGTVCHRLHTSHAFHSPMMDPVLAPFTEVIRGVSLAAPRIPFLSNVTGDWITDAQAVDADYWTHHLRSTVRFSDALARLIARPNWLLLEVGPGQTLSGLAVQHSSGASLRTLPSMGRRPDAEATLGVVYETLGRLWVSGVPVDWSALYRDERRCRVSLPTYPFDRQRYWVEARRPAAATSARAASRLTSDDIANWFYAPSWERTTLPGDPGVSSGVRVGGPCLVFADAIGVADALTTRFEQSGQVVIRVSAGEAFAAVSERDYRINPSERADYSRLFQHLRERGVVPGTIVHLWNVTPGALTRDDPAAVGRCLELGFYSLLHLAKALGDLQSRDRLQLIVVSNRLHVVVPGDRIDPERATLLGPCRVIPQEYRSIACRSVDLPCGLASHASIERAANHVLQEIVAQPHDPVVAFRGEDRWVQRFVRLEKRGDSHEPTRFRPRGVYLITGGLGGIGYTIAADFARTLSARLVLVGRSAVPERKEWSSWLSTHDHADDASRRIRRVQQLEELGAEVLVAAADVSDLERMRAVCREAAARFGPINGVVHAAGVAGAGVIHLKKREAAARVMAPKVDGTRVLERLLLDSPLDFFVLCSSLSSVVGGIGQVDYCAANAYLDAFAHHARVSAGKPVTSVNWDTWQEVGMAVDTPVPPEWESHRAESLKRGIRPAQGAEAFRRITQQAVPQVLVSTRSLSALVESYRTVPADAVADASPVATATAPDHHRPALQTPYRSPQTPTEQTIAGVWQQLLGIDRVGIDDNFFELGGHSLLAIQIVSRLRDGGLEVALEALFDSPTVGALAALVDASAQEPHDADEIAELLERVEQLSDEEVQRLLEQNRGPESGTSLP